MSEVNINIKAILPYFLALIAAGIAFNLYTSSVKEREELQQFKLLAEAESAFINYDFEKAFTLYEQLHLAQVDEAFLSHREKYASFMGQEQGSGEAEALKISLLQLLEKCIQGRQTFGNLAEKSIIELVNIFKSCYAESREMKEQKANLVQQLSKVQYLNFTNERKHNIHYLGTVVDSMAHGEGVGIWDNESFYRGEWSHNKREGYGYFKTAKGEVYEGEYKNDRRNGQGTYFFRNGDYYTGEWVNGERSGFGTVLSARGDTLVHGFWENDRFDRRRTRAYKQNGDEEPEHSSEESSG